MLKHLPEDTIEFLLSILNKLIKNFKFLPS